MPRTNLPVDRPYTFAAQQAAAAAPKFPNFIVRPGDPFWIYSPSWNYTDTVVRFLPAPSPFSEEFCWDPFRLSNEPGQFGDWIRVLRVASNIGPKGVTYLIGNPADVDLSTNPLTVLNNAISAAVASGHPSAPIWESLVAKRPGMGKQLKPASLVYASYAVVLMHAGQPKSPPLGFNTPIVFVMTETAGFGSPTGDTAGLCKQLDERNEDGIFVCPDIIDWDFGMFVKFRQSRVSEYAYDVSLMDSYAAPGQAAIGPSLAGSEPAFRRKLKTWSETLYFPTKAEQISLLHYQGGIPADAIVYALQNQFGEDIAPEIYDLAAATARHRAPVHHPAASAGPPQARPGFMPAQRPARPVAPAAQAPSMGFGPAEQLSRPAQVGFGPMQPTARPMNEAQYPTSQEYDAAPIPRRSAGRPDFAMTPGGHSVPQRPAPPADDAEPPMVEQEPEESPASPDEAFARQPSYGDPERQRRVDEALRNARERSRGG